jgi:hypothetical protein
MHIRKQCEHGIVVAECRCPSTNKAVQIVSCPASCQDKEGTDATKRKS